MKVLRTAVLAALAGVILFSALAVPVNAAPKRKHHHKRHPHHSVSR